MLVFSLIGLVGALKYGLIWTGFDIFFAHNLIGFTALITGTSTFIFKKHCKVGQLAAGLAILALLTGVIAYMPELMGSG